MADTHSRRATYQDILDLPEGVVGELIRGALHTQPRPHVSHMRASSVLGVRLGAHFDQGDGDPGDWVILDETELHFGEDVLVPELAGWRRERFPQAANDTFLTVAPDWVCEILSPSTAQKDRALKAEIYAREGVAHLWFVDPDAKTLEAYRLTGGKWLQIQVFKNDDLVVAEPFDALPFKLDALWF